MAYKVLKCLNQFIQNFPSLIQGEFTGKSNIPLSIDIVMFVLSYLC